MCDSVGRGRADKVGSPHGLVNKTVFKPAGPGLETLQSPTRRQQAEEAISWVGVVTQRIYG